MKMTNGIRISMQYFAEQTKITDLIDPEVMSDMIDAPGQKKRSSVDTTPSSSPAAMVMILKVDPGS